MSVTARTRTKRNHAPPSSWSLSTLRLSPDALIERLEIVGRHSTSALYNAIEHRRIPLRYIWQPLAAVQEGLGGRTKTIILASIVGLTFLVSMLCLWSYPLKMDAQGQLLPVVRAQVYPKREAKVEDFVVGPNDNVTENQELARLYDPKLREEIDTLKDKSNGAANQEQLARQSAIDAPTQRDRARFQSDEAKYRNEKNQYDSELKSKIREFNADPARSGFFSLRAPVFTQEQRGMVQAPYWTVLNANFRDEWINKTAKPVDPLIRLGVLDAPWEIEIRIPQKHIGQVRSAYRDLDTDVLEVDYLIRSQPTRTFKGLLYKNRVARDANISRDEGHEQEPVVMAYVKIFRESDTTMPEAYRVPQQLLVSGAEVHGKIRCGDKAAGYSLFYGVWEFIYEKVVFFF